MHVQLYKRNVYILESPSSRISGCLTHCIFNSKFVIRVPESSALHRKGRYCSNTLLCDTKYYVSRGILHVRFACKQNWLAAKRLWMERRTSIFFRTSFKQRTWIFCRWMCIRVTTKNWKKKAKIIQTLKLRVGEKLSSFGEFLSRDLSYKATRSPSC